MKKLELLEGIRGLAAVYVFLTHFLIVRVLDKASPLGGLFRFGQEAVMVFFLLSGFMIYYSTYRRQEGFNKYCLRRFRRIYPIFLLCLLLGWWVHGGALPGRALLGNLFMLQDFEGGKPGVWFDAFLGNAPLWSLAYEWWFYMLFFPILHRVRDDMQKWVVAGIGLLGWLSYQWVPNQIGLYLSYFVIWWTGVEVAKVYCRGGRPTLATVRIPTLILVFFCGLQSIPVVITKLVQHKGLAFGLHPFLELRHFLASVMILGLALLFPRRLYNPLTRVLKPFTRLAPISYAFYILHHPLAVTGTYLAFLPVGFLQNMGYVLVALGVSWFAEIPYQRVWNRLTLKSGL